MDEQQTQFTNCPGCDEPADPADPDVVYAVSIVRLETKGPPTFEEGTGAFFHNWHFPPAGTQMWRPKPKPQDGRAEAAG
jgi:hypothetical protein